MSIPPKFLSKIQRCSRARTRRNFQVRANTMIKKKSIKKFCCYDQKQQLSFFHICCFFVAICCHNKKMLPKCCPTLNKHFLLKKNFSKSVSNVAKSKNVTLVTGGGVILIRPMYLHHILKLCLRSCQKWPIKKDQTFFLTHRKTKNPLSKKFRHMGFMETFNI